MIYASFFFSHFSLFLSWSPLSLPSIFTLTLTIYLLFSHALSPSSLGLLSQTSMGGDFEAPNSRDFA